MNIKRKHLRRRKKMLLSQEEEQGMALSCSFGKT
jgi:hypothetical protein